MHNNDLERLNVEARRLGFVVIPELDLRIYLVLLQVRAEQLHRAEGYSMAEALEVEGNYDRLKRLLEGKV